MSTRVFFLCAQGSDRALLAASLLHAQSATEWEAYSPPPSNGRVAPAVEQVLQEQGLALLPSDRLILPVFGVHWDQGIVLCSGMADT